MRGPSLPPRGQPDLASYDHILVFTSGGKDSLACLLHLLEVGVELARTELHHHDVDGRGAPFTFADLGPPRENCVVLNEVIPEQIVG
jgi:hypothetical protein